MTEEVRPPEGQSFFSLLEEKERQLEGKIADAQSRADELIATAEKERQALVAKVQRELPDDERKYAEECIAATRAEADRIRSEAHARAETMMAAARSSVRDAVEFVLATILPNTSAQGNRD